MSTAVTDKTNRLSVTASGGKMIADYWDGVFDARERGDQVVWYNGQALNPIFQAAGLVWCHGEAFSARLAAQHLEKPAQLAGEEYGYVGELCSYARTHLGCAVLTQQNRQGEATGVVGMPDQRELASRLPAPDFFVNAYSGCSTGQQWDEISFRVFGKEVPIFNVSLPFLWGNKPDSGYLVGEEWEQASEHVADQLHKLIAFIESMTGRPFDWDALRQNMAYIKRASELRREAMALCKLAPTPATFWDWIASIAHINFLPASQELVDYFAAVKAEIEQRVAAGISGVSNERYRVYFDGIMNWNKLGWLARKFADHDVAVVAGRYTQNGPRVGSFDAGLGTGFLARAIGEKRAREVWFLCRQYSAEQAEAWGLVNKIVPAAELKTEVRSWADEILKLSPTALKVLKQSMNTDTEHFVGIGQMAYSSLRLFGESDEAKEGIAAFNEKRSPDFGKYRSA